MARNTQEFETVIRLNAQQAKDELKTMQERLDELKRKKDTLLSGKNYDAKDLCALNKEIRQQSAAVKAFGSSVQDTFENAPKTKTLGDFCSNVHVDAHHTIVIKFFTDDVPDPRKIYVFDNKRFICQKIELNVSDDGIDKEKTGYFSELL